MKELEVAKEACRDRDSQRLFCWAYLPYWELLGTARYQRQLNRYQCMCQCDSHIAGIAIRVKQLICGITAASKFG